MKYIMIGILAVMGMVAGCATMTANECRSADWYAVGVKDGNRGESWQRLMQHGKACAKVGIVPDEAAWERGRDAGLVQYCTPSNAYYKGLSGGYINTHNCPAQLQPKLYRANEYGYNINKLQGLIKADKKNLATYQEQLKKLKEGDNLNFGSEKEARKHLLELPNKIAEISQRITKNENLIQEAMRVSPWR
ncbi:DUF2799 domain-containing protein [Moraxella sp. ZJ142]|uniref:DUF2799 domain-containing protein n=1 Tax=Moraxella marmotae TaxID=3344520 RepID=UPI0035D42350